MKDAKSSRPNPECSEAFSYMEAEVLPSAMIEFLEKEPHYIGSPPDDILATLERIEEKLELLPEINRILLEINEQTNESPEVIIVEQMEFEILKKKMLEYFNSHEKTDIEELHKVFRCDVRDLIKAIDELIGEGKIEG